jgi:hypothetical protein
MMMRVGIATFLVLLSVASLPARAAEPKNPFAERKKTLYVGTMEYHKLEHPYRVAMARLSEAQKKQLEDLDRAYVHASVPRFEIVEDKVTSGQCGVLGRQKDKYAARLAKISAHKEKAKTDVQRAFMDREVPKIGFVNPYVLRNHLKATEILMTEIVQKIALIEASNHDVTEADCRNFEARLNHYIKAHAL